MILRRDFPFTAKRYLSIRVLLPTVTGLLTLALVAICASYAKGALESREKALRVPIIVGVSTDLFTAIQAFRIERGTVNTALATPSPIDAETQSNIVNSRIRSAKVLNSAISKLGALSADRAEAEADAIVHAYHALEQRRLEVDAALKQTRDRRSPKITVDWIAASGDVVRAIDGLSGVLEAKLTEDDAYIANMVLLKQLVWSLRSNSGDERLSVREAMASDKKITEQQKRKFAALAGSILSVWKLVQEKARGATAPPELKAAVEAADRIYFATYRPKWDALVQDVIAGKKIDMSLREWREISNPGRDAIFMLSQTAFDLARTHAAEQSKTAERNLSVAILFMIAFSLIGVLTVLYVLRGVVRPITQINNAMRLVADGNLTCAIPFKHRVDEIGSLSHSLHTFRDNAIETQRLSIEKMRAETANRTKSEFLANMSHELRTPLNAIIGFSDVMQKAMFGPLSEQYRGYGTDIYNSGTHLLGLINEILDLSKLEAKKLELFEEDVDLAEVIESSVRLVSSQAETGKVQLLNHVDKGLPLIRADERRIRQILINILSNAVKFTPVAGRVSVTSSRTIAGLAIIVSDTGIGIAPEEIAAVLEPFHQIDSKISRQHDGTGLGLPLAKQLVELHGGTLTIESKVDAGTRVMIFLPRERILSGNPRQASA